MTMSTSRPNAGRSILEMLWKELDFQLCKLMALAYETQEQGSAQQGHCLGLAKAIAIMTNPYDPDVDEIRREAMKRYEANR